MSGIEVKFNAVYYTISQVEKLGYIVTDIKDGWIEALMV